MLFQVPQRRIDKANRLLSAIVSDGYASYRELAKIAGVIISTSLAIGPIARLFTRQLYYVIHDQHARVGDHSNFVPSFSRRTKILVEQFASL